MESAEAFLSGYALPLVAGGELHVHRPIDAEDLKLLEAELVIEGPASEAIYGARRRHAAAIWLYPLRLPLDGDELRLLVGLYNLLFLAHPAADRWWIRSRAVERLLRFTARCLDEARLPDSAEEVVARHTLLGNLPRLGRTDTQVKYWAGTRTYIGMAPPTRLLRWQGLRRVRQSSFQVNWLSECAEQEGQLPLLERLLRLSPLTDLLHPERAAPAFEWINVTRHLQRPSLCRLVCHRYLEAGLEQVGPALARAFWRLVDAEGIDAPQRRAALRSVIGLVHYLYAATALVTEAEALPLQLPEDPTGALLSVLMASAGCGLLPSADALGEPAVEERLNHWVRTPARQLGEQASELALRLEVALAA